MAPQSPNNMWGGSLRSSQQQMSLWQCRAPEMRIQRPSHERLVRKLCTRGCVEPMNPHAGRSENKWFNKPFDDPSCVTCRLIRIRAQAIHQHKGYNSFFSRRAHCFMVKFDRASSNAVNHLFHMEARLWMSLKCFRCLQLLPRTLQKYFLIILTACYYID